MCGTKEDLHLLVAISNELCKSDTDLDYILRLIKDRLDADCTMLAILDRTKGEIFIEAVSLTPRDTSQKISYKPGEGIIGKVVESGDMIFISHTANSKDFLNKLGIPAKIDGQDVSFLCLPLKDNKDVIGALCVHKRYASQSNISDNIQLLSILGSMFAHLARFRQKNREEIDRLQKDNDRLRLAIAERPFVSKIQGNSGKLHEVFQLVSSIAPTDTTVLIRGESGVGKELVADAIHFNSLRKDKPFIKVNCAALPESLIESELFGHEKGAFTGANALRVGRFEAANGGTIFLDEFGDVPLNIQVKLLRVLQQKQIERLGSTKSIDVDARIICATNKNLEKMIAEGSFREDLYYRINVFPVYIPALRERLHDIPTLVDHFIARFNEKNGAHIKRITSSAIDMLMAYHFPGNIRELENCIERACILSTDGVIHTHTLPPSIQTAAATQTESDGALEIILGKTEKQIIHDTLIATRGNLLQAAKRLGITERMMGLRVRKYNIDPQRYKATKGKRDD